MAIEFEVSDEIPAAPRVVYEAWLDSNGHSAMTGSRAVVSADPGGSFSAWDDYISGKNIELDPHKRIVQYWRTVEFDENDPDSRLEILIEPAGDNTLVTIRHSNLPEHGMQYYEGWKDSYFTPMKDYFGRERGD